MGRSCLMALIFGGALACEAADTPPNVIFILTDDQRWDSLGCSGNADLKTPELDRLASQGIRFSNAFVTTAICNVSRASIFSGQHYRRHGINDFHTPFSAAQWSDTYPKRLRDAGYRTGFVGKWGVGDKQAQVTAMADEFDFFRGRPGQAGTLFIDPSDPQRRHTTEIMGSESLEFLDGCKAGQPFCLSISFNAPHARDGKPREFEPDDRDLKLYEGKTFPPAPTASQEFFDRLPASVKRSISHDRWALRFDEPEKHQRIVRDYYRLIAGIDREVGRIRTKLQERGLAGNTVIVFTSDHGFFLGERQLADKWYLYEESVRVPLIIFDPRLAESRRGQVVDAMTLNIDFAPTMLDLAGVEIPTSMQGRSLKPWLAAQPAGTENWRTAFFYEHHAVADKIARSEGLRTTDWTLIRWLDEEPVQEELYHTAADPLQKENLIAEEAHQEKLVQLRAQMEQAKREAE